MNELNQMVDVNQLLDNIKTEFQTSRPNAKRILKSLIDLRANKKIQQPSDSEFFDIVGETFKLDPDFFMKELYEPFRSKMYKIIGVEKRHEMDKYIVEKFCLYEDEQIIYECKGNIKQTEFIEPKFFKKTVYPVKIYVSSADLFLTNYRIIAHGLLSARGGSTQSFWFTLLTYGGTTKRAEGKKALIESSQVFGYQFPIKNHWGLGKSKFLQNVAYFVNIDKKKYIISIKPTDTSKREEDMSKIFDILRKDANEVLDVINEVMEIEQSEKWRRRYISNILKSLRKSEEYTDLSDSEFFNIVKVTFKLDPEFFMTSVYPKMMSWKEPSFLSVKEEVITLIDKLNNEFVPSKPEQDDESIKFIKE